MHDRSGTNQELFKEISVLKQRIQELETSEIEYKRTNDVLRESEQNFKAVAENAYDGLIIALKTGSHIYANKRASEITGYSIEELLKIKMQELAHPDEIPKLSEILKKRMAGEELPRQYETAILHKEGKSVPIELTAARTFWHGQVADIVIFRDITERKLVDEEKHRSQEIAERLAKEMAIIAEIGRVIGSTLNIREVYERFADEVQKLIPFDRLSVVTNINPTEGTYKISYVNGIDLPRRKPGDLIPLPNSFCKMVMETRKGMVNNFEDSEDMSRRFPGVSSNIAIQAGLISMINIPLISRDEVIGMLHIRSMKPNAYTEEDLRLAGRIGEQISGAIVNAQFYEELKITHDTLESRVRERTIELEETNTALQVLIKKGNKEQKTLEENLQSNINQLVTPFLSKLRLSQSNPERLTYLNILEANLNQIVSPFINQLSAAHRNLTPKEIQIAEMVKQGKRSKEIAQLFGISVGTVITHRNNIRKKLNLKSRDANLRSHLLSLA